MSTAVAIHQAAPVTQLGDMELGKVLAQSGYFKDARDASQAIVKVLFGREIGIGPVSAMMGIHIIEGKPAPSANLIAARIKSSGRYDYRVREHSAEVCRIEFVERATNGQRESLGIIEWSMEDARRAGLGGRGPWKSYPRAMLFARAVSEGARVHCPELFGGAPVYTPEELGAEVDGEGNVVEAEVEEVEAQPAGTPEQIAEVRHLLADEHVTDEERAKVERRIERGMTPTEAIAAADWLVEQIETRIEREAIQAGELGEASHVAA